MSDIIRRINLGCGSNILDGWGNYDVFPCSDQVKHLDLNKLPLPFDDSSVDEIKLSHVLEHLVYQDDFIRDCHRILKKNGRILVTLPVRSSIITHKTHYHNYGYFDPFLSKDDRLSAEYSRDYFVLNSIRKKKRSLKQVITSVFEFFKNFFYEDYTWELVKK